MPLFGFDDLWATDADTRMRGYDNAIAAGGDDAAPTERSGPAADQSQDGDAG